MVRKIEPERQATKVEQQPIPTMKLRGIIFGGRKHLAIINDQFGGKGDRVGDFRVMRIGKNEVLLASGYHKIKLELVKNE